MEQVGAKSVLEPSNLEREHEPLRGFAVPWSKAVGDSQMSSVNFYLLYLNNCQISWSFRDCFSFLEDLVTVNLH